MSEMIDIIASAMMAADVRGASYQDLARAALKAARNPTPAMIEAAYFRGMDDARLTQTWQQMIDEALL